MSDDLHVKLLKPYEVAAILNVSVMTVYRLLSKGTLPYLEIGHSFRIPEDGLRDYMHSVTR